MEGLQQECRKDESEVSPEERMWREMLRDVGVPEELQMSQMAHSLKSQCGYSTSGFETLKCHMEFVCHKSFILWHNTETLNRRSISFKRGQLQLLCIKIYISAYTQLEPISSPWDIPHFITLTLFLEVKSTQKEAETHCICIWFYWRREIWIGSLF